jgi:hypothetical protein
VQIFFYLFKFSLTHYCCALSHTRLSLELFSLRCWCLLFSLLRSPSHAYAASAGDTRGAQGLLDQHMPSGVPDHCIADTWCPFRYRILQQAPSRRNAYRTETAVRLCVASCVYISVSAYLLLKMRTWHLGMCTVVHVCPHKDS